MVDLYGGTVITTKADIWVRSSMVVDHDTVSTVVSGANVDSFVYRVNCYTSVQKRGCDWSKSHHAMFTKTH